MTTTGDGFQVAEYDLRTRGPGDFFGMRQHGLPQLQFADLQDLVVFHQRYLGVLLPHGDVAFRVRMGKIQAMDRVLVSLERLVGGRGHHPGDFFGMRQHGLPQLQFADLATDSQVLRQTQQTAARLLAEDPALRSVPQLAKKRQTCLLVGENGSSVISCNSS